MTRFSSPVSSSSTAAYWPGEADLLAQRGRVAHHVEAGDPGAAGVGLQQGRQHAHGGRLPGAVRAEQAEDGALLDLEIDAVERADVAERLDQSSCADGGF